MAEATPREPPPPAASLGTHGRRATTRVRSATQTMLGPLWVTTFREPVRTGRLRLDGLSFAERQLARIGLVTMVLLLGSLLFVGLWRRGNLLHLAVVEDPQFVPEGLVPVTLIAFFVALALIMWGAMDAAVSVRLLVAVLYVTTVALLGAPTTFAVGDSWMLEHGPTVLRVGFWAPFGALLLSALLSRLARVDRWATPVLRAVCLLGFAAMLVSLIGMHVAFAEAGFGGNVQSTLHSGFTTIDSFLIPLIFVAAVAVVDFATDVSTSVAEPLASAPPRWGSLLRYAVVGLLLVKLWVEVVSERDYWTTYLTHQPLAVARTVLVIGMLALVTAVAHRKAARPDDSAVDEMKEKLTLGGAFVTTVAGIVGITLLGFAELVLAVSSKGWAIDVAGAYPVGPVADWVPVIASVAALVVGVRLLRTGSRRLGTARSGELGSGLVILGAWNLPAGVLNLTDFSFGFSYPTVDVVVTLAVLVWLLVRWSRVGAAEASLLVAVVVFSWLVMSRGDYISYLGGLLGLPGTVVLVFGILYTLFSGSSFASESSARLPREARTLMFVGYLLLSVSILHWLEAIHSPPSDDVAASGFYYLGIPLAAWLLARRVIPRRSEAVVPQEDVREPAAAAPH